MTDSYKASHWKQYPRNTQKVYAYFESRGGKYDKTVFFGLQYYLKKYLSGPVVTKQFIDEAEPFFASHFGNSEIFNRKGWEYILTRHYGHLPIEIKAIPEGTVVDTRNVLFTVENTDEQCFWLTTYLETLLEQVWYPITIATKSREMKKTIKSFKEQTGGTLSGFELHDFGYRGSTSQESAAIGGAAHLVNFIGSDTIAAISLLKEYYSADMPAFSVPAAEHSTITSWGEAGEKEAYRNMLEKFPTGIVAVVSDSYNIFEACRDIWGEELKELVEGRNGTVVVRPDSGHPDFVIPKVLSILADKFGYTMNEKGYKLLPPQIRLIQGDGINEESLTSVLMTIAGNGWSAENIVFGSGGGLLQNVSRDTLGFAYKCSNVTIRGKDIPVRKNPITDSNKVSKSGRLSLIQGDKYVTYENATLDTLESSLLQTVFKDGKLTKEYSLDEIRERAKI